MHHIYMDPDFRTIADLSEVDETTFELNRVNVPVQHRGFGHGSKLLRRVTADADAERKALVLNVHPSGPLDEVQLTAWYKRHGFEPAKLDVGWQMIRYPRET